MMESASLVGYSITPPLFAAAAVDGEAAAVKGNKTVAEGEEER